MPAKSRAADHSGRRGNHDHTAGLSHDHASVEVATAIRAAMCAAAAAFRGLGSEAREAQQGGECRNRKNFSAHLLGFLVFAVDGRLERYKLLQCAYFSMNPA
jgi:hypothetical protein